MRKLTRLELETRLAEKERSADLHMLALHDVINNKVEKVGFYKHADERYTFTASRLESGCGGLFMISFSCEGQSISTSVSYLDDCYHAAQNGLGDSLEAQARCQAIYRAVSLRNSREAIQDNAIDRRCGIHRDGQVIYEGLNIVAADMTFCGISPDSMYRVAATKEVKADALRQAIEYQGRLTKAGKEYKRA